MHVSPEKRVFAFCAFWQQADMNAEITTEAIEIISMQVDKHIQSGNFEVCEHRDHTLYFISIGLYIYRGTDFVTNYLFSCQVAARNIKKVMDKKYGPHWHCVVGEGYGMDITHQKKNMIFLYYMKMAILLFKCQSHHLCSYLSSQTH